MSVTKADITKPFKLNGLILSPDASDYLLQLIERVETTKRQKVLRRLIDTILKQKIDDTRISKSLCEQVVNDCKADRNVDNPVLYVIDAFKVPRFMYSSMAKKFIPLDESHLDGQANSLFPSNAQPKAFLYANRYEVVYQRVLRHQVFSRTAASGPTGPNQSNPGGYRVRPIEYLLSSGTRIESVIALGMLGQLRDGDWHLEDPTGIVRLDLTDAVFHEGLFPEGCIVLVEGSYEDRVLRVTGMGLPPCESAESSRRVFSVSNPFGGGPVGAPAAAQDTKMQRLLTTTQAGADAMLVLLGETCLDRPDCLDRLTTLFNGYCDCPPVAFVLTGNFLGPSANGRSYPERVSSLRQLLIQLITVYKNAFPDIDTLSPSRCPHLILVPGPTDPVCAPSSILPRPGFPFRLFSDILDGRRVGNDTAVKCPPWLHLASNPCRLRLYTREIVVFRAEYSRLLIRHCIHLPAFSEPLDDAVTSINLQQDSETQLPESQRSGDENTPTDDNSTTSVRAPKPKTPAERLGAGLARCLASQAHLLPLMGHIAPVYWAFDQALSLQPLPDLVVAVEPQSLADLNSTTANPIQTGNCRFINPDQFGRTVLAESTGLRTEYAFKVYYPLTGVVENSRLPD